MAKDLYRILELTDSATESEIESAYRRLAADCCPENGHTDQTSAERYRQLTDAYGILSDMDRRAAYDIQGKSQRKRIGSSSSKGSAVIRAREILNRIFLCGAAVTTILFLLYLSGNTPVPFYIVCGISLCIKLAEYIMRLIQ